jgi:hypothetical protein
MTPEDDKLRRDRLRAALNALKALTETCPEDQGMEPMTSGIESAREELVEAFGDNGIRDITDVCEGCLDAIIVGEKYVPAGDGVVLCAECAPTWGEAKAQWDEFPDAGEDGDGTAFQKMYQAHIAGGGSADDKIHLYTAE